VSGDYHRQLEELWIVDSRAFTSEDFVHPLRWAGGAGPLIYFGLNEGTALTNARWLAQHLKSLGYQFFHIDEGYQYARASTLRRTPSLFRMVWPLWNERSGEGLIPGLCGHAIPGCGPVLGLRDHRDWLVHNAKGEGRSPHWASRAKSIICDRYEPPTLQEYF